MEKRLLNALVKVGELKIRNAFHQSTFIYGTQGTGSVAVRALRKWNTGRAGTADAGLENLIGRKLNLFEPGRRVEAYLAGGYQMMDMYYGQAGNEIYSFRDPVIAEYVHYAMGYTRPFSLKQTGRDAYLEHFGKSSPEGWKESAAMKQAYGMSATKEISRIIRDGIRRFGGTLIFEGRDIFYSQVFDSLAPWQGDTDLEAQELFKYFMPDASKAQFGKGKIIFHWNGKETVPTKYHFMSNWKFSMDANKQMTLHKKGNVGGLTFDALPNLRPIWGNFADVPSFLLNVDQAKLLTFLSNHGSRI